MSEETRQQRGQFSLRSFLIWVAVIGTLCGLLGPAVITVLFRWSPADTTPRPAASTWTTDRFEPSSTYYESGETPLR